MAAASAAVASAGRSTASSTVPGPADGTGGGSATAAAAAGAPVAGSSGGAATASAAPCAAPSDATGVTSNTISIGEIATVTGPVPGLGQTALAAVRAYLAYRNATGGVCGRQLALVNADDGGDAGAYRAAVADMSTKVLGLAGSFAPSDGAGYDIVQSTGLPIVSSIGEPQLATLPTVFNINPPPTQPPPAFAKFRYLVDHGVHTAAVVTLAAAASVAELDKQQAMIEAAGIQIVNRQVLPIATFSFDAAARAVANSGAQYLFFLGADTHDAAMAQSMRGTGYKLLYEEYLTGYGSSYLDIAGAATEGTTSWIRSLPGEDGGANAEQAAFQQWMGTTAPTERQDVFAADAWASAKAFFDALTQLPGPISRQALVAQLHTYTSYDAGGFIGRIDLANDLSNNCVVGMQVEGGKWHRLTPDQGFLC